MTALKSNQKSGAIVLLAHLGAFLTVSAWGTSFICSKVLMEDGGLTPVETYVYRFTLAYIVLLLFTFRHLRANSWRDELTLAISGLCAGSIYFITENYALQNTTTANVSMLSSLSPIITTLLVGVFYHIKIQSGTIIGSLIALVGVGCIIFSHGEGLEIRPAGDLVALCSSISWAIYTIVVKRILPFYNSFFVTRKLFFYGVIFALPMLLIQDAPLRVYILFDIAQPQYLLNFLFLVVVCSLFSYVAWNEEMKILGPVTTNNYMYLQPIVTMVVGYLVLGEAIYPLGYIGCVLVLGGLILADKWKGRVSKGAQGAQGA